MAGMSVKPVTTQKQQRQFIDLPWTIYADDPLWIPPLRANQRHLVGYHSSWAVWNGGHPFHETAEVQTFLAYRDGQVCGRIAAIVNQAHIDWQKERRGFFGFFEAYDDQEVASALFDAARHWLSDRDIHVVRGPTNPSQNYECGLLIDGFDSSPFFMMTYNPPYYASLWESYGFEKAQDLYAYWGHVDMLAGLDEKLAFIAQSASERFNITLRTMDKSRFRAEVATFLDIYNQSMAATWGFVPLTKSEGRKMAASMRMLIVPELTVMAEVDNQPVGGVFGLLDYNPRIKEIDGRLFPLGFATLLRNRRKLQRVRFVSTNVIPAYQRWGVGLVMLHALVPKVLDWGVKEAEFSWVMESNDLSRRSLEKGGAKRTKTYRIYDLPERSRA